MDKMRNHLNKISFIAKTRCLALVIFVFLSPLSSLAAPLEAKAEASDSEIMAAAKRRQSAIIEQDHLTGKIAHFEESLLPRSMIIPSQLRTPIDTRTSKIGDLITVETKEDLLVSEEIIIPAGSYLKGYISKLEKPGRMMKDPKIEVDFNTVYIAGQKEQLHVLGKIKAKQLQDKATKVSDGVGYSPKAKKAAMVGGVLGASGAFAFTQMIEPFATFGMSGMLDKALILGSGVGGIMLGMSMITRDDARIETGTPLDIILEKPSEAI